MIYETTCSEETASCAHYRTFLKAMAAKAAKDKMDRSGSIASRAPA